MVQHYNEVKLILLVRMHNVRNFHKQRFSQYHVVGTNEARELKFGLEAPCLFVCFSHFLPLERLGGLESHVQVAMV